jgi:hypothetical protein
MPLSDQRDKFSSSQGSHGITPHDPVVLPPEKMGTSWYHPVALKCMARAADCYRKYLEIDTRLAAGERRLLDVLSDSQEAIAFSRHLLAETNGRDTK